MRPLFALLVFIRLAGRGLSNAGLQHRSWRVICDQLQRSRYLIHHGPLHKIHRRQGLRHGPQRRRHSRGGAMMVSAWQARVKRLAMMLKRSL